MDLHGSSSPRGAGTARAWVLDAAGATALTAFAWLAWRSRQAEAVPLNGFFTAMAVAWGACLVAWRGARGLGAQTILRRVWMWAIAFRVIGFIGEPVLEDDHWRYLWDGRMLVTTGNPYATRPIDHFGDEGLPERFQVVLDRINHPDVPTIYGPGCQAAFGASYAVAPGRLWPLKLLLIGADLLTLLLLQRLAAARHLLLYAWCPLLIQETAFTAHPDSLAILCGVAAMVAAARGRWYWSAFALALAVGTRALALPLVPFILLGAPRRVWLVFGVVLAGMALPFWLQGTGPGAAGSAAFAGQWEFNSTLFALARGVMGPGPARVVVAVVFGVFVVFCLSRTRLGQWARGSAMKPALPRGEVIMGALLLLAPVANPWYALWLVPFVALRPSAAGLTALAVVTLSYAHGLHLGAESLAPYEHPWWVRPAEVALIALAACWDGRRLLGAGAEAEGQAD